MKREIKNGRLPYGTISKAKLFTTSDYDYVESFKTFSGRMTKKRYKIIDSYCRKWSNSLHCGHEHDCCGCMSRRYTSFEYSKNQVVVKQTMSFNY